MARGRRPRGRHVRARSLVEWGRGRPLDNRRAVAQTARSTAVRSAGSREAVLPKITTFLTYVHQAEEAASFYVPLFPNSRITQITRFGEGGPAPAGSVMTVGFELDGREFVALNGGPHFQFTEAASIAVGCDTQEEIDFYWEKLSAGGTQQVCGWLKDRFGLSWQVHPNGLGEIFGGDPAGAKRAMAAMMTMTKFDLAALRAAYEGK